jgi:hypothetical protein
MNFNFQSIKQIRKIIKFPLIFLIWVCLTINAFAQIDNPNITALDCKTWDEPFRTPAGATHRNEDPNLLLLNNLTELNYQYFADEITIRWLVKDTAIINNIQVYNPYNKEKNYSVSMSNVCGLTINLGKIYEESYQYQSTFIIGIKRKKGLSDWLYQGLSLFIEPTSPKKRKRMKDELTAVRGASNYNLIASEIAFKSGFMVDALTFLERAIKEDPSNRSIQNKYSEIVKDMRIKR